MNNLQRYEEIPGICENKDCLAHKSFELYDVEKVEDDEYGREILKCYECGENILLDK